MKLFPKLQTFSQSVEPLLRNRDPNMTQNEHVYAICCRPEEGDDVISGQNGKTIDDYVSVNFQVVNTGGFFWRY